MAVVAAAAVVTVVGVATAAVALAVANLLNLKLFFELCPYILPTYVHIALMLINYINS